MPLPLSPMTELEAVNAMLGYAGETPVNSLDESGLSEASIARGMLHRVSRYVQSIGLHCNTDTQYPIPQDMDGFIRKSPNMLNADPSDPTINAVFRGDKLYNKDKHSFVWDNPVEFDITWFFPYEDLPSHVRDYIMVRAARMFQVETLGAVDLHRLTEADELQVVSTFKKLELRNKDATLLDTIPAARVVKRSFL